MTRTSKFWSFSADHFLLIGLVIKPTFAACWQGRAYKRRNGPILDYHIFFMWVEGGTYNSFWLIFINRIYDISHIKRANIVKMAKKNSFLALFCVNYANYA